MDGGDVEVVLGVSMTPEAVRMVLVEGADADGVTVDHLSLSGSAGSVEQVVAAILGTRESAIDSGHRLVNVGVAWTDHSAAARLRDALRPLDIVEVTLVSELHAASALAVAIGRKTGCRRIALLFVDHDRVTLAVVQTADGAVVRVSSRSLGDAEAIEDVPGMVAALETVPDPPQEVFVVGPGAAADTLTARIAATTALTVHRPRDAELALARGAALACATVPRFDAETVGLGSAPDWFHDAGIGPDPQAGTEAGPTLLADAGRALGYSAFPAEAAPAPAAEGARWDAGGWGEGTRLEDTGSADTGPAADDEPPAERPVLLLGSALTTVFVIGFVALVISLAVTIRPAVDSRPAENATGTGEPAAPETIRAPVPVAREAPRAVVVPMPAAVPAPAAAVPVPAAAPAAPPAALPAPAAPAPAPAVTAPAAPGAGPPLTAPQILVPEVIAALLPPALRGPTAPAPRSTTPAPSVAATTAETSPATSPATSPPTSAAPSSPPQATGTQAPTTEAEAPTTSQQSATTAATGSTITAPATEPAAQPTPAQTVPQSSAPAPTTTTAATPTTPATAPAPAAPARSSAPDCASPAECPA